MHLLLLTFCQLATVVAGGASKDLQIMFEDTAYEKGFLFFSGFIHRPQKGDRYVVLDRQGEYAEIVTTGDFVPGHGNGIIDSGDAAKARIIVQKQRLSYWPAVAFGPIAPGQKPHLLHGEQVTFEETEGLPRSAQTVHVLDVNGDHHADMLWTVSPPLRLNSMGRIKLTRYVREGKRWRPTDEISGMGRGPIEP